MKIGCGEWGFRELELEQHFQICQAFGFRTMEIGIGGGQTGRLPQEMTAAEIKQFQQMREAYQIATPFCCIENDFTLPDSAAHQRMLASTLEQIRLAAQLGAQYVRLFAGFTPITEFKDVLWVQLIDALTQCDALCQQLGLSIGIETHGKITMKNGAARHEHTASTDHKALAYLLEKTPASIGINYDPGNLKAVNPDDKTYALDVVRPRINYCHLKDWRRFNSGWEACAPGDDDLDYSTLIPRIGFEGVYLIEYEPTADIEDGLRRSLDYLGKHFQLEFAS